MRFLNIIIMFLIAFSLSGIVLYSIGPNLSTEAVAEKALAQLEESGKMEEMIQYIEQDPRVYQYMEEIEARSDTQEVEEEFAPEQEAEDITDYGESISTPPEVPEDGDLAFETKEDAASLVVKKVGFRNLLKMKNAVENDEMSADEVMGELEEDLNEEEMLALKVMIFKEWQSKN